MFSNLLLRLNITLGFPDARGFGIFRETRKVTVSVNDGTNTFTVELNNLIPADLWKNLGLSWSNVDGLKVGPFLWLLFCSWAVYAMHTLAVDRLTNIFKLYAYTLNNTL